MTCVGSLKKINIRLASGLTFLTLEKNHEIVSLVGNISMEREHVHIGLSDEKGLAFGGHLLDGNLVYTTAEIVLGVLPQLKYSKAKCEKSGWEELIVSKIN
jgi:predicted DNA-binding protein with PD1-like motif